MREVELVSMKVENFKGIKAIKAIRQFIDFMAIT